MSTTPSQIDWTDTTWSPVTGCTKISQGCKHCWAEQEVSTRWSKNPLSVWHGRDFTDIRTHPEALGVPLKIKRPQKIFVCPRADLFHEAIPVEFIDQVFAVMALCPEHIFQVLTKRPARMLNYFAQNRTGYITDIAKRLIRERSGKPDHPVLARMMLIDFPWPHIWLGVSIEDQITAAERIPLLLECPAALRWISAEPLLGPVDLTYVCRPIPNAPGLSENFNFLTGHKWDYSEIFGGCPPDSNDLPNFPRLDWIIVGGESGSQARPMHPDWVRSIRDQCQAADVPFFFKQWGEWREFDHGPIHGTVNALGLYAEMLRLNAIRPGWIAPDGRFSSDHLALPEETPCRLIERVGKKVAGHRLDGQEYRTFPISAAISMEDSHVE